MPIVSNSLETSIQTDGRISYILRLYDQDGSEYMSGGLLPAGFDTATLVQSRIAEKDVQLAEMEFKQIIGL